MGYYTNATICKNGHTVNSSKKVQDKYCYHCGAETISECPHCNIDIRGDYEVPNVFVVGDKYDVPKYCFNCGKPFPWTEQAISNMEQIILENSELSLQDNERLIESLPHAMAETPSTSLAATRIKKALINAGTFTADALRQFVIDFGCEMLKNYIMNS